MRHHPNEADLLTTTVDGPPERRLRANDGSSVVEFQTHVGNVKAPDNARETLELYGICTDYAIHRQKDHAWERCLFSEEFLQMIRELRVEDQFPFEVEAVPSEAEAEWRIARAAGAIERTPVPLLQYLLPASDEALARLQSIVGEEK